MSRRALKAHLLTLWRDRKTLYTQGDAVAMADDIRTAIALSLGPIQPRLERAPATDPSWAEGWQTMAPEDRMQPRFELWKDDHE
jgi:hypothetical protein